MGGRGIVVAAKGPQALPLEAHMGEIAPLRAVEGQGLALQGGFGGGECYVTLVAVGGEKALALDPAARGVIFRELDDADAGLEPRGEQIGRIMVLVSALESRRPHLVDVPF